MKRETLDILLRHREDQRDVARRRLAHCVEQTREAATQREQSQQRVFDERERRELMHQEAHDRACSDGVSIAELQRVHLSADHSRAREQSLAVAAQRAAQRLVAAADAERDAMSELGRAEAEHQAAHQLAERRRSESARAAELVADEEAQQTWSARSRR